MKESDINKEIRDAYAQSPIATRLTPEGTVKKFSGLSAMYNFYTGEVAFWNGIIEVNKISQNAQNRLIFVIRDQVTKVIQYLHNICNSSSLSPQCLRDLQEIRRLLSLGGEQKIIYRTSNTVNQLADMCASGRYDDNYINSYIFFLQNGGFKDVTFQGQLSAYLAQNPFSSPSQNLEFKNHLDEIVSHAQDVLNTTEHEQSEYWDTVKEDYKKITTGIKSEYEMLLDQQQQEHEEQSNTWSENLKEAKDRLTDLENLYQEKLRLEAPATYWKELEKEYIDKGKTWVAWAVASTFVLGVVLVIILYFLPDSLKGSLSDLDSGAIRSTLILAVIVSTAVYLIRLFVKLATSSFHLARDAKERFTLANLYLSLTEKDAIVKDSRDIILNALFSRADTGLLKGDSSPSFPIEGLASIASKSLK